MNSIIIFLDEQNDKYGKWDLEQQFPKCVPYIIIPVDAPQVGEEGEFGIYSIKDLKLLKKKKVYTHHVK